MREEFCSKGLEYHPTITLFLSPWNPQGCSALKEMAEALFMYLGETVLNFQPNWLDVSQMEPGGRVLYFHPEKLCRGLGKHELGLNLLAQKLIL